MQQLMQVSVTEFGKLKTLLFSIVADQEQLVLDCMYMTKQTETPL